MKRKDQSRGSASPRVSPARRSESKNVVKSPQKLHGSDDQYRNRLHSSSIPTGQVEKMRDGTKQPPGQPSCRIPPTSSSSSFFPSGETQLAVPGLTHTAVAAGGGRGRSSGKARKRGDPVGDWTNEQMNRGGRATTASSSTRQHSGAASTLATNTLVPPSLAPSVPDGGGSSYVSTTTYWTHDSGEGRDDPSHILADEYTGDCGTGGMGMVPVHTPPIPAIGTGNCSATSVYTSPESGSGAPSGWWTSTTSPAPQSVLYAEYPHHNLSTPPPKTSTTATASTTGHSSQAQHFMSQSAAAGAPSPGRTGGHRTFASLAPTTSTTTPSAPTQSANNYCSPQFEDENCVPHQHASSHSTLFRGAGATPPAPSGFSSSAAYGPLMGMENTGSTLFGNSDLSSRSMSAILLSTDAHSTTAPSSPSSTSEATRQRMRTSAPQGAGIKSGLVQYNTGNNSSRTVAASNNNNNSSTPSVMSGGSTTASLPAAKGTGATTITAKTSESLFKAIAARNMALLQYAAKHNSAQGGGGGSAGSALLLSAPSGGTRTAGEKNTPAVGGPNSSSTQRKRTKEKTSLSKPLSPQRTFPSRVGNTPRSSASKLIPQHKQSPPPPPIQTSAPAHTFSFLADCTDSGNAADSAFQFPNPIDGISDEPGNFFDHPSPPPAPPVEKNTLVKQRNLYRPNAPAITTTTKTTTTTTAATATEAVQTSRSKRAASSTTSPQRHRGGKVQAPKRSPPFRSAVASPRVGAGSLSVPAVGVTVKPGKAPHSSPSTPRLGNLHRVEVLDGSMASAPRATAAAAAAAAAMMDEALEAEQAALLQHLKRQQREHEAGPAFYMLPVGFGAEPFAVPPWMLSFYWTLWQGSTNPSHKDGSVLMAMTPNAAVPHAKGMLMMMTVSGSIPMRASPEEQHSSKARQKNGLALSGMKPQNTDELEPEEEEDLSTAPPPPHRRLTSSGAGGLLGVDSTMPAVINVETKKHNDNSNSSNHNSGESNERTVPPTETGTCPAAASTSDDTSADEPVPRGPASLAQCWLSPSATVLLMTNAESASESKTGTRRRNVGAAETSVPLVPISDQTNSADASPPSQALPPPSAMVIRYAGIPFQFVFTTLGAKEDCADGPGCGGDGSGGWGSERVAAGAALANSSRCYASGSVSSSQATSGCAGGGAGSGATPCGTVGLSQHQRVPFPMLLVPPSVLQWNNRSNPVPSEPAANPQNSPLSPSSQRDTTGSSHALGSSIENPNPNANASLPYPPTVAFCSGDSMDPRPIVTALWSVEGLTGIRATGTDVPLSPSQVSGAEEIVAGRNDEVSPASSRTPFSPHIFVSPNPDSPGGSSAHPLSTHPFPWWGGAGRATATPISYRDPSSPQVWGTTSPSVGTPQLFFNNNNNNDAVSWGGLQSPGLDHTIGSHSHFSLLRAAGAGAFGERSCSPFSPSTKVSKTQGGAQPVSFAEPSTTVASALVPRGLGVEALRFIGDSTGGGLLALLDGSAGINDPSQHPRVLAVLAAASRYSLSRLFQVVTPAPLPCFERPELLLWWKKKTETGKDGKSSAFIASARRGTSASQEGSVGGGGLSPSRTARRSPSPSYRVIDLGNESVFGDRKKLINGSESHKGAENNKSAKQQVHRKKKQKSEPAGNAGEPQTSRKDGQTRITNENAMTDDDTALTGVPYPISLLATHNIRQYTGMVVGWQADYTANSPMTATAMLMAGVQPSGSVDADGLPYTPSTHAMRSLSAGGLSWPSSPQSYRNHSGDHHKPTPASPQYPHTAANRQSNNSPPSPGLSFAGVPKTLQSHQTPASSLQRPQQQLVLPSTTNPCAVRVYTITTSMVNRAKLLVLKELRQLRQQLLHRLTVLWQAHEREQEVLRQELLAEIRREEAAQEQQRQQQLRLRRTSWESVGDGRRSNAPINTSTSVKNSMSFSNVSHMAESREFSNGCYNLMPIPTIATCGTSANSSFRASGVTPAMGAAFSGKLIKGKDVVDGTGSGFFVGENGATWGDEGRNGMNEDDLVMGSDAAAAVFEEEEANLREQRRRTSLIHLLNRPFETEVSTSSLLSTDNLIPRPHAAVGKKKKGVPAGTNTTKAGNANSSQRAGMSAPTKAAGAKTALGKQQSGKGGAGGKAGNHSTNNNTKSRLLKSSEFTNNVTISTTTTNSGQKLPRDRSQSITVSMISKVPSQSDRRNSVPTSVRQTSGRKMSVGINRQASSQVLSTQTSSVVRRTGTSVSHSQSEEAHGATVWRQFHDDVNDHEDTVMLGEENENRMHFTRDDTALLSLQASGAKLDAPEWEDGNDVCSGDEENDEAVNTEDISGEGSAGVGVRRRFEVPSPDHRHYYDQANPLQILRNTLLDVQKPFSVEVSPFEALLLQCDESDLETLDLTSTVDMLSASVQSHLEVYCGLSSPYAVPSSVDPELSPSVSQRNASSNSVPCNAQTAAGSSKQGFTIRGSPSEGGGVAQSALAGSSLVTPCPFDDPDDGQSPSKASNSRRGEVCPLGASHQSSVNKVASGVLSHGASRNNSFSFRRDSLQSVEHSQIFGANAGGRRGVKETGIVTPVGSPKKRASGIPRRVSLSSNNATIGSLPLPRRRDSNANHNNHNNNSGSMMGLAEGGGSSLKGILLKVVAPPPPIITMTDHLSVTTPLTAASSPMLSSPHPNNYRCSSTMKIPPSFVDSTEEQEGGRSEGPEVTQRSTVGPASSLTVHRSSTMNSEKIKETMRTQAQCAATSASSASSNSSFTTDIAAPSSGTSSSSSISSRSTSSSSGSSARPGKRYPHLQHSRKKTAAMGTFVAPMATPNKATQPFFSASSSCSATLSTLPLDETVVPTMVKRNGREGESHPRSRRSHCSKTSSKNESTGSVLRPTSASILSSRQPANKQRSSNEACRSSEAVTTTTDDLGMQKETRNRPEHHEERKESQASRRRSKRHREKRRRKSISGSRRRKEEDGHGEKASQTDNSDHGRKMLEEEDPGTLFTLPYLGVQVFTNQQFHAYRFSTPPPSPRTPLVRGEDRGVVRGEHSNSCVLEEDPKTTSPSRQLRKSSASAPSFSQQPVSGLKKPRQGANLNRQRVASPTRLSPSASTSSPATPSRLTVRGTSHSGVRRGSPTRNSHVPKESTACMPLDGLSVQGSTSGLSAGVGESEGGNRCSNECLPLPELDSNPFEKEKRKDEAAASGPPTPAENDTLFVASVSTPLIEPGNLRQVITTWLQPTIRLPTTGNIATAVPSASPVGPSQSFPATVTATADGDNGGRGGGLLNSPSPLLSSPAHQSATTKVAPPVRAAFKANSSKTSSAFATPTKWEKEVVIRNVIRSVLWQLRVLHRRGFPHGGITGTNVFFLRHAVEATQQTLQCSTTPVRTPFTMPPTAAQGNNGKQKEKVEGPPPHVHSSFASSNASSASLGTSTLTNTQLQQKQKLRRSSSASAGSPAPTAMTHARPPLPFSPLSDAMCSPVTAGVAEASSGAGDACRRTSVRDEAIERVPSNKQAFNLTALYQYEECFSALNLGTSTYASSFSTSDRRSSLRSENKTMTAGDRPISKSNHGSSYRINTSEQQRSHAAHTFSEKRKDDSEALRRPSVCSPSPSPVPVRVLSPSSTSTSSSSPSSCVATKDLGDGRSPTHCPEHNPTRTSTRRQGKEKVKESKPVKNKEEKPFTSLPSLSSSLSSSSSSSVSSVSLRLQSAESEPAASPFVPLSMSMSSSPPLVPNGRAGTRKPSLTVLDTPPLGTGGMPSSLPRSKSASGYVRQSGSGHSEEEGDHHLRSPACDVRTGVIETGASEAMTALPTRGRISSLVSAPFSEEEGGKRSCTQTPLRNIRSRVLRMVKRASETAGCDTHPLRLLGDHEAYWGHVGLDAVRGESKTQLQRHQGDSHTAGEMSPNGVEATAPTVTSPVLPAGQSHHRRSDAASLLEGSGVLSPPSITLSNSPSPASASLFPSPSSLSAVTTGSIPLPLHIGVPKRMMTPSTTPLVPFFSSSSSTTAAAATTSQAATEASPQGVACPSIGSCSTPWSRVETVVQGGRASQPSLAASPTSAISGSPKNTFQGGRKNDLPRRHFDVEESNGKAIPASGPAGAMKGSQQEESGITVGSEPFPVTGDYTSSSDDPWSPQHWSRFVVLGERPHQRVEAACGLAIASELAKTLQKRVEHRVKAAEVTAFPSCVVRGSEEDHEAPQTTQPGAGWAAHPVDVVLPLSALQDISKVHRTTTPNRSDDVDNINEEKVNETRSEPDAKRRWTSSPQKTGNKMNGSQRALTPPPPKQSTLVSWSGLKSSSTANVQHVPKGDTLPFAREEDLQSKKRMSSKKKRSVRAHSSLGSASAPATDATALVSWRWETSWFSELHFFPMIEAAGYAIPPPEWIQSELSWLPVDSQEHMFLTEMSEPFSPFRLRYPNTVRPHCQPTLAADVWMLGMLLLEMTQLAEELPWGDDHDENDGIMRNTTTAHSSSSTRRGVSAHPAWHYEKQPLPMLTSTAWSTAMKLFVQRCLRQHPDERASVEELLDDPWFTYNLAEAQKEGGGRDPHATATTACSSVASPTPTEGVTTAVSTVPDDPQRKAVVELHQLVQQTNSPQSVAPSSVVLRSTATKERDVTSTSPKRLAVAGSSSAIGDETKSVADLWIVRRGSRVEGQQGISGLSTTAAAALRWRRTCALAVALPTTAAATTMTTTSGMLQSKNYYSSSFVELLLGYHELVLCYSEEMTLRSHRILQAHQYGREKMHPRYLAQEYGQLQDHRRKRNTRWSSSLAEKEMENKHKSQGRKTRAIIVHKGSVSDGMSVTNERGTPDEESSVADLDALSIGQVQCLSGSSRVSSEEGGGRTSESGSRGLGRTADRDLEESDSHSLSDGQLPSAAVLITGSHQRESLQSHESNGFGGALGAAGLLIEPFQLPSDLTRLSHRCYEMLLQQQSAEGYPLQADGIVNVMMPRDASSPSTSTHGGVGGTTTLGMRSGGEFSWFPTAMHVDDLPVFPFSSQQLSTASSPLTTHFVPRFPSMSMGSVGQAGPLWGIGGGSMEHSHSTPPPPLALQTQEPALVSRKKAKKCSHCGRRHHRHHHRHHHHHHRCGSSLSSTEKSKAKNKTTVVEKKKGGAVAKTDSATPTPRSSTETTKAAKNKNVDEISEDHHFGRENSQVRKGRLQQPQQTRNSGSVVDDHEPSSARGVGNHSARTRHGLPVTLRSRSIISSARSTTSTSTVGGGVGGGGAAAPGSSSLGFLSVSSLSATTPLSTVGGTNSVNNGLTTQGVQQLLTPLDPKKLMKEKYKSQHQRLLSMPQDEGDGIDLAPSSTLTANMIHEYDTEASGADVGSHRKQRLSDSHNRSSPKLSIARQRSIAQSTQSTTAKQVGKGVTQKHQAKQNAPNPTHNGLQNFKPQYSKQQMRHSEVSSTVSSARQGRECDSLASLATSVNSIDVLRSVRPQRHTHSGSSTTSSSTRSSSFACGHHCRCCGCCCQSGDSSAKCSCTSSCALSACGSCGTYSSSSTSCTFSGTTVCTHSSCTLSSSSCSTTTSTISSSCSCNCRVRGHYCCGCCCDGSSCSTEEKSSGSSSFSQDTSSFSSRSSSMGSSTTLLDLFHSNDRKKSKKAASRSRHHHHHHHRGHHPHSRVADAPEQGPAVFSSTVSSMNDGAVNAKKKKNNPTGRNSGGTEKEERKEESPSMNAERKKNGKTSTATDKRRSSANNRNHQHKNSMQLPLDAIKHSSSSSSFSFSPSSSTLSSARPDPGAAVPASSNACTATVAAAGCPLATVKSASSQRLPHASPTQSTSPNQSAVLLSGHASPESNEGPAADVSGVNSAHLSSLSSTTSGHQMMRFPHHHDEDRLQGEGRDSLLNSSSSSSGSAFSISNASSSQYNESNGATRGTVGGGELAHSLVNAVKAGTEVEENVEEKTKEGKKIKKGGAVGTGVPRITKNNKKSPSSQHSKKKVMPSPQKGKTISGFSKQGRIQRKDSAVVTLVTESHLNSSTSSVNDYRSSPQKDARSKSTTSANKTSTRDNAGAPPTILINNNVATAIGTANRSSAARGKEKRNCVTRESSTVRSERGALIATVGSRRSASITTIGSNAASLSQHGEGSSPSKPVPTLSLASSTAALHKTVMMKSMSSASRDAAAANPSSARGISSQQKNKCSAGLDCTVGSVSFHSRRPSVSQADASTTSPPPPPVILQKKQKEGLEAAKSRREQESKQAIDKKTKKNHRSKAKGMRSHRHPQHCYCHHSRQRRENEKRSSRQQSPPNQLRAASAAAQAEGRRRETQKKLNPEDVLLLTLLGYDQLIDFYDFLEGEEEEFDHEIEVLHDNNDDDAKQTGKRPSGEKSYMEGVEKNKETKDPSRKSNSVFSPTDKIVKRKGGHHCCGHHAHHHTHHHHHHHQSHQEQLPSTCSGGAYFPAVSSTTTVPTPERNTASAKLYKTVMQSPQQRAQQLQRQPQRSGVVSSASPTHSSAMSKTSSKAKIPALGDSSLGYQNIRGNPIFVGDEEEFEMDQDQWSKTVRGGNLATTTTAGVSREASKSVTTKEQVNLQQQKILSWLERPASTPRPPAVAVRGQKSISSPSQVISHDRQISQTQTFRSTSMLVAAASNKKQKRKATKDNENRADKKRSHHCCHGHHHRHYLCPTCGVADAHRHHRHTSCSCHTEKKNTLVTATGSGTGTPMRKLSPENPSPDPAEKEREVAYPAGVTGRQPHDQQKKDVQKSATDVEMWSATLIGAFVAATFDDVMVASTRSPSPTDAQDEIGLPPSGASAKPSYVVDDRGVRKKRQAVSSSTSSPAAPDRASALYSEVMQWVEQEEEGGWNSEEEDDLCWGVYDEERGFSKYGHTTVSTTGTSNVQYTQKKEAEENTASCERSAEKETTSLPSSSATLDLLFQSFVNLATTCPEVAAVWSTLLLQNMHQDHRTRDMVAGWLPVQPPPPPHIIPQVPATGETPVSKENKGSGEGADGPVSVREGSVATTPASTVGMDSANATSERMKSAVEQNMSAGLALRNSREQHGMEEDDVSPTHIHHYELMKWSLSAATLLSS